jgi:hypothetical protein
LIAFPEEENVMDRVTAQFRAPVVGVARHFIEML